MDSAILSALSALGGSCVGALAPVFSNVLLQRSSTQREFLTRSVALREKLYSEFIQLSSELYVNSLTSSLEDFGRMVGLYELVSRIRLIASDSVVSAAEEFVKEILRHFSEENLTVEQLQAIALSSKEHPLRHFSEVCRAELRSISRNMRLPTA